ncbi:MAG: CbiX/SirB N-terminal domain-containing protein [Candidatus Calescibacterium sp.]|jgi:sirohydrochlorin ferrochelatase|nr:CbiX/SirB N-terminal domain-containing protein [Candidatus Calescibacterium sp.]
MKNNTIGKIKKYFVAVAHGSPDKLNEEDFSHLCKEIEQKIKENDTETTFIKSYLEFGQPRFDDIVEKIIKENRKENNSFFFIKPLLFFRAGHMQNDIEAKLKGMENVRISGVLAESERFQKFFSDFINNFLQSKTNHKSKLRLNLENPLFIFVARGTSSKTGASQAYSFCRIIWENLGKKGHMEVCFADVTKPSLKDVIDVLDLNKFTSIVVIPAVLFRGFVMKKIGKELASLLKDKEFLIKTSNSGNIPYVILPPCGYYSASRLADVLAEFPE